MVVIRGIQESEDMDEKVGMIMEGTWLFRSSIPVMGRIGGLRKRGAEESDHCRHWYVNRLVSLKMESVAVKLESGFWISKTLEFRKLQGHFYFTRSY